MAKNCRSTDHRYEYQGKQLRVICELPRDHDGPHAAWTWENPPYPRHEWSDEESTQISVRGPNDSTEE